MKEAPFYQKLNAALARTWASPGSVTVECLLLSPDRWRVIVCPSLREIVGGQNDGTQVVPSYALLVNRFVQGLFDKRPKIVFECGVPQPQLKFFGKIDGIAVFLQVLSSPNNDMPVELAYEAGPKAGTVETQIKAADDERLS